MSAVEIWCLVGLVLAALSAVLYAIAPRAIESYSGRAAPALLAGSVGALAIALWIAFP